MALRRVKDSPYWHLDLWVPDASRKDGRRRVIESLRTRDEDQARRLFHLRAAELLSGGARGQAPTNTVGDLYRRVVAFKSRDKAQNTVQNYRTAFGSFFQTVPEDTPLKLVDVEWIDRWRLAAGVKASTINEYAGKVGAAFRLAARWKLLPENPFADVEPFAVDGREDVKYLTADEVAALKAVLETAQDWHLVGLMLHAGLRVSEAVRLRAGQVTATHVRVEMKTKNRTHRLIPMTARLREILDAHPFAPLGLTRNAAYLRLCALGQKAGIRHTHPHMLRHTFSAFHLSGGDPPKWVSNWLGHASLAITEAVYGHLIPGAGDHAIDAHDPP